MTRKKILIVEDEPTLLKALQAEFSREDGFDVIIAHDGEEGLKVALSEHPSLILLDLLMPKMDGMAMLKKLREDTWGKNVKVIILTNLDERGKVAEAVQNEVFDYMIKSNWNIGDVRKRVINELKYIK